MNDCDIQKEVDQLKEKITDQMHHSFLIQYMNVPEMDEEKLSVLYRILRETSCSRQQIDTYAVTIMLVQIALDAHDLVSVNGIAEDEEKKGRQLTILGGDYFSGLYYHLLSELEDIGLIRAIAASIRAINEHKMSLYRDMNQTFAGSVDHLRVIESSLLRNTADYFALPVWGDFSEEYFLLRRLLEEKHLYLQSNESPVIDAVSKNGRKKEWFFSSRQDKRQQLTQLLDSYIDRAGKAVEKLFSNHSRLEKLADGLIWDFFLEKGTFKQKLAEEG
ncbi:MAG TPA: heptaprenyl diphosphate synthase component 1 [Bacillales bacterium]|nr:heptaprenyl diphosphate synthase component 1 [Bacillales bacterium]